MNRLDDIKDAPTTQPSWQFGELLPTQDTMRLVERKMAEGWGLLAVAPISAEDTILDIRCERRRKIGFEV